MKTTIKVLFAIVSIALITACGGGSSSPEVTTCCQTTVCSSRSGKAYYDEQCGLTSPVYDVRTLFGHPTPTGMICTLGQALYACQK